MASIPAPTQVSAKLIHVQEWDFWRRNDRNFKATARAFPRPNGKLYDAKTMQRWSKNEQWDAHDRRQKLIDLQATQTQAKAHADDGKEQVALARTNNRQFAQLVQIDINKAQAYRIYHMSGKQTVPPGYTAKALEEMAKPNMREIAELHKVAVETTARLFQIPTSITINRAVAPAEMLREELAEAEMEYAGLELLPVPGAIEAA